MNKTVVLVSGGMDSVTALYWAHKNCAVIGALSFHYGSKHNDREIPFAQIHCQKLGILHKIVELPFVNSYFKSNLLQSGGEIPEGHYEAESMKQTVVPFRNGIMLSIAAGITESWGGERLVIASHAGDHAIYPDCREDFMRAMSQAIYLGTYAQISIERPFIDKRKEDIARIGASLGVDFSLTWSCYKGKSKHCGKCGTCVERQEAFVKAKIPDLTCYEN